MLYFTEWLDKIGCGLHGCAYKWEGDVIKITTKEAEAKVAEWLIKHPHPNIAEYKAVTKTKEGWVIVMEEINTRFAAKKNVEKLRNEAEKAGNKGPSQIAAYLEKHHKNKPYVKQIVSALKHLMKFNHRYTDFLNPNNMGLGKNGQIKLFDLQ